MGRVWLPRHVKVAFKRATCKIWPVYQNTEGNISTDYYQLLFNLALYCTTVKAASSYLAVSLVTILAGQSSQLVTMGHRVSTGLSKATQ